MQDKKQQKEQRKTWRRPQLERLRVALDTQNPTAAAVSTSAARRRRIRRSCLGAVTDMVEDSMSYGDIIREDGAWYLERDGERIPLRVVAVATELVEPEGARRTEYLQPITASYATFEVEGS